MTENKDDGAEITQDSESILPIVREAREEDLPSINGFYRGEYGTEYPGYLKPEDLVDPSRLVVVAEANGEVVGAGQAAHFRGMEDVYELKGLVVKENTAGTRLARNFLLKESRY